MKKHLTASIIFIIVTFGLLGAVVANIGKIQDLRNRAAPLSGSERLFFNPVSSAFPTGKSGSFAIHAQLTGFALDGIQAVVDLTGTIPADISVTPNPPAGMVTAKSEIVSTGNGKRILLAFISTNPLTPPANKGLTILGTVHFTAPATGNLTATFNALLTKVLKTRDPKNIAAYSGPSTYRFVSRGGEEHGRPTPTSVIQHEPPARIPSAPPKDTGGMRAF